MTITIKKWSVEQLAFFFLLFIWHRGFYLIPETIFGYVRDDVVFGICIVVFLMSVLINQKISITRYFNIFAGILVLIVISAFMAHRTDNQAFMRGIINNMGWIAISLTYFPISTWIQEKRLTYDDIETCIVTAAFIEVILVLIQFYAVGMESMFLSIKMNERYESARLYLNNAYVVASIAIICRKIAAGENSVKNWLVLALLFMAVVFVIKSRIGMVIALFVAVFTVFFSGEVIDKVRNRENKRSNLFKIFLIIAGIALIFASRHLKLIQDFMFALRNPTEDGSLSGRLETIEYFIDKWRTNNWTTLFGYGYAARELTLHRHIIADTGFFAFLYLYGVAGVIWLIALAYKTIKDGLIVLKTEKNGLLLALALANFIGLSVTYFSGYYFAYTMLIIVIAEAKIYNYKAQGRKI